MYQKIIKTRKSDIELVIQMVSYDENEIGEP